MKLKLAKGKSPGKTDVSEVDTYYSKLKRTAEEDLKESALYVTNKRKKTLDDSKNSLKETSMLLEDHLKERTNLLLNCNDKLKSATSSLNKLSENITTVSSKIQDDTGPSDLNKFLKQCEADLRSELTKMSSKVK